MGNGIPHIFWVQYPDLTFDKDNHIYRWKGKERDSVTTIMDRIGTRDWDAERNDWGFWNPVGCPEIAKTEHDQNFGNALHKIIAYMFWDFTPKYPEEMKPWVEQVEKFLCDYPLIPLYDKNHHPIVEYPMYSDKYGYAGQIDFAGLYQTRHVWLIDWKSSLSYMENYAWQTAGYEQLLREVFGGELFDKRAKIHRKTILFSDKKYDPRSSDDPRDWIMFQSFLNILRRH